MEFRSISSSTSAITELSRRLGQKTSSTKPTRTIDKSLKGNLLRASKLSKKVIPSLKLVLDDSELIGEYLTSVELFNTISNKIINKLGGHLNVKEDIEEN